MRDPAPGADRRPSAPMSQLRENAAYERLKRNLNVAQAVLLLAMLTQSPYLVRLAMPTLPLFNAKFMGLMWFASAVLGIAGFLMVYRQLDLARDDSQFEGIGRFIGARLQASLKLFFLLAFLMPIMNLPATIWAWFQAQGAVGAINRRFAEQKQQRERRDKFRP
jgi:hypothetical protein